jgi:hypothetical protein
MWQFDSLRFQQSDVHGRQEQRLYFASKISSRLFIQLFMKNYMPRSPDYNMLRLLAYIFHQSYPKLTLESRDVFLITPSDTSKRIKWKDLDRVKVAKSVLNL